MPFAWIYVKMYLLLRCRSRESISIAHDMFLQSWDPSLVPFSTPDMFLSMTQSLTDPNFKFRGPEEYIFYKLFYILHN